MMQHVMQGGLMLSDILYGLLSIIVILIGAWCKSQETKIQDLSKENGELRKDIAAHWEQDARNYVSKTDFTEFAKEIKECLVRIESKIERSR
jgi:uncharacterized protein Yka (UPF0111/DUF47 family)